MMNIRNISLLLASLALAGVALAGEETKMKMAIALVDSDSDGEIRLELDGDELGFNLHDMQEGENRAIVDKEGRNVLITREADGFKFDIDGKTIKMPLFDGEHHGATWVSDGNVEDVDIHAMHDRSMASATSLEGVMIVSEKPIDDATRQAIKSMLESAGHGSEVRFIDTSAAHDGVHGIKVIEKKVELRSE
jgi:hypothetical protein